MRPSESPGASGGEARRRQREKIAILGGGAGAMAAAFALTDPPNWQDRYEITVYQLGWRLGGKGASGRNFAMNARIEEHGLHVWLGFYENAFRLIRRCYGELNRPAGAPLATWREAFQPQNYIVYAEWVKDRWSLWPVTYPFNDDVPGDGGIGPDPWDFVLLILNWLRQMLNEAPPARRGSRVRRPGDPGRAPAAIGVSERTMGPWAGMFREVAANLQAVGLSTVGLSLQMAHWITRSVARGRTPLRDDDLRHLAEHFQVFQDRVWRRLRGRIENDPVARHLWVEVDMILSVVVGMLLDGVVTQGFGAIDDRDFAEWLKEHGADEQIAIKSSWVRAVYDFVFGFAPVSVPAAGATSSNGMDGPAPDPTTQPNRRLAAGVGLRGLLRLALTYKGAMCWKMAAGMGDVVFAPLYQVLERRGVKFQFFHRVEQLHLSADQESIESISMTRQATVKGGGEYAPLVLVKDLPCWPSTPLYDQLEEGDKLQARRLDLESSWAERPPWEVPLTLHKGHDFDQVVLGISLGALPIICPELIAARPAWKAMVENVKTERTQSCQLWLKPDGKKLGWEAPGGRTPPIIGAYVEPLSSWADMSHLVEREDWPPGAAPGTIAYACGPLADPGPEAPPPPYSSGSTYPDEQDAAVQVTTREFLQEHADQLWPGATIRANGPAGPRTSSCLHWDHLVGEPGQTGPANLQAQYFRANVDPSSRYVLSVPGSTKYRLKSDRSGFANLFLAGDWTYNGINGGCVEAAVMSGLRAARGISGYPSEIIGESID